MLMLNIICGEDSIKSRNYYLKLRQEYISKGFEIHDIKASELAEINKWLSDSASLFSSKIVFFTEGLNKKISKRLNPKLFSLVENLAKKKDVELVDWEEYTSSRELKLLTCVNVKEFKPESTIFKFLDACYPGNIKQFISLLYSLPEKIDEGFIFIMLVRHIRNLFVIRFGGTLKSLQSWQTAKLKTQSRLWNDEKLISFYEGLYRIDQSVKTNRNPFSVRKSLDLLACYFL